MSVLGSPVCLACGAVIPKPKPRQKACSPRCRFHRWAATHRGRGWDTARQARDQEVLALLEAALQKLEEGSP